MSVRGIYTIFGSTRQVRQKPPDRDTCRDLVVSFLIPFFNFCFVLFVYSPCRWRGALLLAPQGLIECGIRERRGALLFTERRESAAFVVLLFCRSAALMLFPLLSSCVIVIFYFFVLFVNFCRFLFLNRRFLLKQNKRATWRSLICTKWRNLQRN